MCEDGPTLYGYEKRVGTGQSGVETFNWGEPSNPCKRVNKYSKLEMMMMMMMLVIGIVLVLCWRCIVLLSLC